MSSITRRDALLFGAGLTVTLIAADPLMATPDEAAAEISKFTGGKPTEAGKISIDLPEIAENGNTVPLSIKARVSLPVSLANSSICFLVPGSRTHFFSAVSRSRRADASKCLRNVAASSRAWAAKSLFLVFLA